MTKHRTQVSIYIYVYVYIYIYIYIYINIGTSPVAPVVKNLLPMQVDVVGFDPWIREIPCRRAQQPTPVFFPGESHGQKSLVGYSPWCCTESDTTEAT